MSVSGIMNRIDVVIDLARKLTDQMEAYKHLDQPELLEVQLFNAIKRYEQEVAWDNVVVEDDDGEIG